MSQVDFRNGRRTTPPKQEEAIPDRLPPHSMEFEMAILGCILIDPNGSMADCIPKLKAGGDEFYDLRHQTIYGEMLAMYDERAIIDVITLQQRLKDRQLLDQIGRLDFLASLPEKTPSAANLSYYLESVCEKYSLRQMIRVAGDVIGEIYEFTGDSAELWDRLEHAVITSRQSDNSGEIPPMKEVIDDSLQKIEQYYNRAGKILGLATGFIDLDKMTGGFMGGEMIVIAARPSMGKTSLAMQFSEYIATELGLPVGVFSLEMKRDSLVLRMLCSRAKVNLRNIKEGYMAEHDFPRLTGAAGKLSGAPIWIEDASGYSILTLKAKARRMVRKYGVKALVIDYLQLLHATIGKKRIENRSQEIAEVSRGVKELATELNIPIIILSQIGREVEKENRRPRMSDLRESGAIEQDADFIGLLYKTAREKEKNTSADDESEEVDQSHGIGVTLDVAKQRNGPTGKVHLVFLKQFTRFEMAAKIGQEDVPPENAQQLFDTPPETDYKSDNDES